MRLGQAIIGKRVSGALMSRHHVEIEFDDGTTLKIEADGPIGSRISVEADVKNLRFNTDATENDE